MINFDKNRLIELLRNSFSSFTQPDAELVLKLNAFRKTKSERDLILKQLYISEFSPLSVVNLDMDRIMIDKNLDKYDDFVIGFDNYLSKTESEIKALLHKNQRAMLIFKIMLCLEQPYSSILYFEFFKHMPAKEIEEKLFISKSTYYRKRDEALERLAQKLAEQNIFY